MGKVLKIAEGERKNEKEEKFIIEQSIRKPRYFSVYWIHKRDSRKSCREKKTRKKRRFKNEKLKAKLQYSCVCIEYIRIYNMYVEKRERDEDK